MRYVMPLMLIAFLSIFVIWRQASMAILEALGRSQGPMALGAVAARLGLNKSTARHLIATLCEHGFARQDPATKEYGLGTKFLEMGHFAAQSFDLRGEAEPMLRELAVASGEVAHLMVLDQGEVLYLAKVQSQDAQRGLRLASYVGMRNPAHSSSAGKVLLAHLPEEEAVRILRQKGMPPRGPKTITNLEEFLRVLAQIRRQGYALDDEENEAGVRCVGAPVRNAQGEVVAAISVSGPASRVTEEALRGGGGGRVKEASRDVSAKLGYRPIGRE
jgi:DNA-binding IclR family transcriptional regulator